MIGVYDNFSSINILNKTRAAMDNDENLLLYLGIVLLSVWNYSWAEGYNWPSCMIVALSPDSEASHCKVTSFMLLKMSEDRFPCDQLL